MGQFWNLSSCRLGEEMFRHPPETERVRFVFGGGGATDAPALATATVGVATGAHGTGSSAEAADIVLLVDDVTRVADAVEVGQRKLLVARQSISVGLGVSFGLMGFAAFGLIPPVAGALAQENVDVLVILNAPRAKEVNA